MLTPAEARALHDEIPVIDLHADTPKMMEGVGYDIAVKHERVLPSRLRYLGHVDLRDPESAASVQRRSSPRILRSTPS